MPQQFDPQRLDPQTVQQILARAADLQQAHLETLSPDQLEALAAEVGIRPEFVRRALAEGVSTPRVRRRAGGGIVPLSARDVRAALAPAALYALYAAFAMTPFRYGTHENGAQVLLALVQPALLAAWVGWRQPHRRMGMLAGGAMGLFACLAVVLASAPGGMPTAMAFVFGPMLAVVGGGAAALSRWWRERADGPLGEADPS